MIIPKQYLHDRLILLLGSVNAFLLLALLLSVLLRVDSAHTSFIVQYRANLPIDAFKSGASSELYSFALFGVLVFAFHVVLSLRAFLIHRQLAVAIMGLGTLLLGMALIVSNALLILR